MSRFMKVYKPVDEGLIANAFFKLVAVTVRMLSKDQIDILVKELGTDATTKFFDTLFNSIKDKYKDDIVKEIDTWKIWSDEYGKSRVMDMFPTINGYHICVTKTKSEQDITTWSLALVLYDKKSRYKDDTQCRLFSFKVTKTSITTYNNPKDSTIDFIDSKKLKLPFKVPRE